MQYVCIGGSFCINMFNLWAASKRVVRPFHICNHHQPVHTVSHWVRTKMLQQPWQRSVPYTFAKGKTRLLPLTRLFLLYEVQGRSTSGFDNYIVPSLTWVRVQSIVGFWTIGCLRCMLFIKRFPLFLFIKLFSIGLSHFPAILNKTIFHHYSI